MLLKYSSGLVRSFGDKQKSKILYWNYLLSRLKKGKPVQTDLIGSV